MTNTLKVGFVSLGCPKNLVDSEVMMGILTRGGYELTPRASEADVLATLEKGDLKGKKIGSTWRISKAALDEFMKS